VKDRASKMGGAATGTVAVPGQSAVATDPARLKKWAGDYMDFTTKARIKLKADSGRLVIGRVALVPRNDSVFVHPNSGASYTFRAGKGTGGGNVAAGGHAAFVLRADGFQDRVYEQVEKIDLPVTGLAEYEGVFYSGELDARYAFSVKDSVLFVKGPRNDPMKLSPFLKDIFIGPFTAQFLRDKKGRVNGLLLTTGRSRNIYFDRVDTR
jgi:hypothetical protein